MKKYIKEYINEIESKLKGKTTQNDIDDLLIKIKFFSHERLVHLIVMLFVALFTILFIMLSFYNSLFDIIAFISGILLVFYIMHYFFLENSIQYMYKLYDKMKK
ncbi:MAG: hypothetical protein PUA90_01425 [bacterium]|nr:hypothetical protein [bacterium]